MPCNDLCSKIHCKGPEFCEEPSKSNAGTKSDKKISEDARPNEIRMADIAAKPSHQKRYAKRREEIILRNGSAVAVDV